MATDIVKQGYVKLQSKNLGVWNRKWLMLRRQSGKGPLRLEKYKDEDTASVKSVYGADRKIIDLTRVERTERLPESVKKHGIAVLLANSSTLLQFCANSEMEAESWLSALRDEMHPENRISHESFPVYMMPNDYFSTPGDCTLQLERDSIRILERYGNRELITWPYSGLRRYGLEGNMFTIEAGAACPRGEGEFHFRCNDCDFVYQRVHALVQATSRTTTNAQTTSANHSSFSQAGWSVASLDELSQRRTTQNAATENQNHYRLDESMPERSASRRVGPLPPTPGAYASRNEDPYSQAPEQNRAMNGTDVYGASASSMGRSNSSPAFSQEGAEGARSPYYSVTRQPTNGIGGGGQGQGQGQRTDVPMATTADRSVRMDDPYYAVSQTGRTNQMTSSSNAGGSQSFRGTVQR